MMKLTILFLTIICLQVSAKEKAIYRERIINNNIQLKITGRVLSESGEPLAVVSVIVKSSQTGTTTDVNGNFSITVPDDAILIFSAVGYENEEVSVSGKSTINISLRQSNKVLDQVIVIGYGTQRKKDLTGASISIKGSEIANLPTLSATQAIQGKAAGVQIINSGAPGSAPNVRIRGTGSILGGVDPLYVVDGIITDDIRNINSADILTIDILKDASSTAIYGARAANGVILITTKAGNKSKKLSISYNAFAGVRILNHKVDMAGPNLFAVYSNEAAGAPNILATDITGSADWYSEITRPAVFQNHNLSVSGGINKYRYYLSAGYLNENGILTDNNYQRFTVRLNHDYAISSKFKIGNNLAFSHYKSENKPYNLFSQAYIAAPIFNATNPDGTYGNTDKSDVGNPLATLKTTNSRSYGNRITGTLWGEYQIIKGLSFKSSFGIDAEQNNGWNYTPVYNTYYANGGIAGQKNEKSDLNFYQDSLYHWTWDNFFTYEIKLSAAHNLKLTAGHTAERRNGWSNNSSIANGTIADDKTKWVLNPTDTAGGQQNTRSPAGYYKRESYFIRANYAFMEKILLNATFRRDGSSNFPAAKRWGNFPAVGLGWIVTKENFMQQQTAFDFLKLRASYGLVGNDVAPPNQFSLTPSEFMYAYFGTNRINGATVTSIKDPNLQWEVVKEFDFGIEFSAFNKKLTGEVDYYHKNATKALFPIPLPNLGFGSTFITNAANILNQGVELSLGWNDVINKNSKYTVRGNITFNKNSVESIGIGQAIPDGNLANGKTATLTSVGQQIGSFWVYKTDGIFQTNAEVAAYPHIENTMPGDFRLVDINKDGVIDDKDKYFAGSYQPKIYYGINAALSCKQFDFGLDIFGNAGNKVYNAKKGVRYGGNYNVEYAVATNRWIPGSDINDFPRAFNGTTTVSDYFVESGSFIRINNFVVGYTFKFKNEDSPFQNVRIYANAQNPFIYTKYTGFTPELPGSPTASGIELNAYPISASYMIGVNIQLK